MNLEEMFDSMFEDGSCEEDILLAFHASLARVRLASDDEEDAAIIQKRLDALQTLHDEWVAQNLEDR